MKPVIFALLATLTLAGCSSSTSEHDYQALPGYHGNGLHQADPNVPTYNPDFGAGSYVEPPPTSTPVPQEPPTSGSADPNPGQ